MRSALSLFIILACFVGCGSLKAPEFRGVENWQIRKLGFGQTTLYCQLHYFNPNPTRLKLKTTEGEAWIEGRRLGHFSIDSLVNIPAKGEFWLPVTLNVDMKKIWGNSIRAVIADSVQIRLEGKARLGKGPVYINYPLVYQGTQSLRELVK